jgi:uncharacterized protein YndB with AHSA1/START domain
MSVPDGKSLAMSWEIPHPPAKVWRALTESDLLAKWIMSNDMKPIVGHKFTFRTEPTPGGMELFTAKFSRLNPRSFLNIHGRAIKMAPVDLD